MSKATFVVFTNCTDASREEEFNRWYTHTHLPDLSKARGLVKSRRFRHLRSDVGEPSQYMAVYEIDSDDIDNTPKDFMGLVAETFAKGRHIDCFEVRGLHLFEEIDPNSLEKLDEVNYPKQVPPSQPTPGW